MLVTEKQEILAHDRCMRSGGRTKFLENNESCPLCTHTRAWSLQIFRKVKN